MPRSVVLALVLVLASGAAACRGCSEPGREGTAEVSGPTMPTGMLAPLPNADPAGEATRPAERLAMARGKKAGEWAELQIARSNDGPDRRSFERWAADSRFLSLEAMGLLHDAFARAVPGFDLFLPRLLDGAALVRLRAELATMKAQTMAIPDVATAQARWSTSLIASLPDDSAWLDARAALVGTIDDLSELAGDLAEKGQSLWVLGI